MTQNDDSIKTEAMAISGLLMATMAAIGIPKHSEATQLAVRMLQSVVEKRLTDLTPDGIEKELTFALASLRLDTTAPKATC